jgi:hypothetical protein
MAADGVGVLSARIRVAEKEAAEEHAVALARASTARKYFEPGVALLKEELPVCGAFSARGVIVYYGVNDDWLARTRK